MWVSIHSSYTLYLYPTNFTTLLTYHGTPWIFIASLLASPTFWQVQARSPSHVILFSVGGFEVDGNRYSIVTGDKKTQTQAAQYCSDNGLGHLAAITYTHKHKQIRLVRHPHGKLRIAESLLANYFVIQNTNGTRNSNAVNTCLLNVISKGEKVSVKTFLNR